MTTVAANKTVAFFAPYTGKTFQQLTELMFGTDGYLTGGKASDDGTDITIEPITIVQRGIIAETSANAVLTAPSGSNPWYVLAAIPDDDADSGVIFSVTEDRAVAAAGLLVA